MRSDIEPLAVVSDDVSGRARRTAQGGTIPSSRGVKVGSAFLGSRFGDPGGDHGSKNTKRRCFQTHEA